MDPTAPDNKGQNPQSPQNPIQPGQFVVAGEDGGATTPTAAPPQEPTPQPKVSLAGQRQPDANPQVVPNAAASGATNQPDPTPFNPSAPGQTAQGANVPPAAESAKKSGGMKIVLVFLAILALVGIIAAVIYFFVLPMVKKQESTTDTADTMVEEPSPPAQRTEGGFGQLPESTGSAQDSPTASPTTDPLASPALQQ